MDPDTTLVPRVALVATATTTKITTKITTNVVTIHPTTTTVQVWPDIVMDQHRNLDLHQIQDEMMSPLMVKVSTTTSIVHFTVVTMQFTTTTSIITPTTTITLMLQTD